VGVVEEVSVEMAGVAVVEVGLIEGNDRGKRVGQNALLVSRKLRRIVGHHCGWLLLGEQINRSSMKKLAKSKARPGDWKKGQGQKRLEEGQGQKRRKRDLYQDSRGLYSTNNPSRKRSTPPVSRDENKN